MIDNARFVEYAKYIWIDNINNYDLFIQSLTHKTYSKDFVANIPPHNERLEFLWDAVLGLMINHKLFLDNPDLAESKLTLLKISMVRMENLAKIAKSIWLDQMILLWNGEERKLWRDNEAILCDCLEWLIWYIYLDHGYDFAYDWITRYIYNPDIIIDDIKSYKAKLQELVQLNYKILPIYEDLEYEKDESKNYVLYKSLCYINDKLYSEWFGTNKKKAQEEAAKIAYEKFNP